MKLTIQPLSLDLASEYLDFFDHRAFSDNNPNGPCYCNASIMTSQCLRQMESEFGNDCKGTLRRWAVQQLSEEQIHGYLAFDGDVAIGWCNAGDMESYAINHFNFIPNAARENTCGKTMSIVCFAIAPEYRGMGVSFALLERICADAKTSGYVAVEGYAEIQKDHQLYDFHGPIQLYKKAGFVELARYDDSIVLRKIL